MSVYYHPCKANVVADDLSRLSMGSVAHVEDEMKDLVNDVQRLARLGVCIMSISDNSVTVHNGAELSLVVEVKEKQDNDPIMLEVKGAIHNQRVEVFSQWRDGATKICRDLREVYWLNGMRRDIEDLVRLPRTRNQLDSIWVIVDQMTKSSCFLEVKTADLEEDYAKI
ncbi:uncharacterized protein [Solanum lycopersicum]|uniref:uncharacterized protein n=1 Tax=Solanum lycopersicum TaxID=4081 RepID=UPI003747DC92